MGEEGDLCLRMLATGYVTRLGCAEPLHHFESPLRGFSRADYCGRRSGRDGQCSGSRKRANERRRIMTRHVRPVTLDCLEAGFVSDAWRLYRTTFGWHLRLGRWKYLLGFPLKALAGR
jgi:hypothetical protein